MIAHRELFVAAGNTAQATFAGLPAYPYDEAEIEVRDLSITAVLPCRQRGKISRI